MTNPPSPILGVLLAGGQSRRMGNGDKYMALLGGQPLLVHAIERFRPQVAGLIINANGDPERFARFDLPVAPDTIDGFIGPLAGILAGMLWARRHAPETRYVAAAATDTPFFPRDLVSHLLAAIDNEHELAIARYGGQDYPVFGLFPITLADDLEVFLRDSDNLAVMAWIDRHRSAFVAFDPPPDPGFNPFLNINRPEDMAMAEETMRALGLRGPDSAQPMR
jgi:molybdenum cofactor guanylyltransferase